jgi:hypothetical protein
MTKDEQPEQSTDNDANTLSRGEVLCMLSDSLRKVHAKLNTGRISKKDHVKLVFLKAQINLSESYLTTLESYEAEQTTIRDQERMKEIEEWISILRKPGAIQFFKDNPDVWETCGAPEEEEGDLNLLTA